MFISTFLACCYVRTEKHLFLSQEKMLRRSSRKNATKAAPGVERPTHSVTGSCHRRQEMPREKATVARSWEELGAGRLLQSEGRKQNSFPVFVSRSRLVICRQADRHKICRSESPASWRISPSHMSPIHGPAPSRMGGGAGGGCKPVHKFVCCGVCVSPYASTRMGGWAAGRLPMCPYLLRAGWRASQTILTPAGERERGREREREREVELALSRPPTWAWWWACVWGGVARMVHGDGRVSQMCAQYELPVTYHRWWHQSASQANLLPAPRPCETQAWNTVHVCTWSWWYTYGCLLVSICTHMHKKKQKKSLQHLRDIRIDLLLWPVPPKTDCSLLEPRLSHTWRSDSTSLAPVML